jgi:hypothetical protein
VAVAWKTTATTYPPSGSPFDASSADFSKRIVGLVVATVGTLLGLAAMLPPFTVGFGSSTLFGTGILVAPLRSWWILGATGSPDFADSTEGLE